MNEPVLVDAPALIRFRAPAAGDRIGLVLDGQVYDVTGHMVSLAAWLQKSAGRVEQTIDELVSAARSSNSIPLSALSTSPQPDGYVWLAPVDVQDVWAAGVTYQRSRQARQEEAVDGGDIYARVYAAERPELFFKARAEWVVSPYGQVGIRSDATWSVPEPELALVINPAMEVVGLTIGNDMSSRDIEGANPLYLPQAKIYTASCALGPAIRLGRVDIWPDTTIRLHIRRNDVTVFEDSVATGRIHRQVAELVSFLGRSNSYPNGVVLLTGTGIVPPNDFTLAAGDQISITIDGIGSLINTVIIV